MRTQFIYINLYKHIFLKIHHGYTQYYNSIRKCMKSKNRRFLHTIQYTVHFTGCGLWIMTINAHTYDQIAWQHPQCSHPHLFFIFLLSAEHICTKIIFHLILKQLSWN